MLNDDHCSTRQEVTEEEPEKQEASQPIVQKHLLKVIAPLSDDDVTNKTFNSEAKLEQSIEKHNLIILNEWEVNEAICLISMATEIPRIPVLVFADHVAPDRRDSVDCSIKNVPFNFLRDFDSLFLADRLSRFALGGYYTHDKGSQELAGVSQRDEHNNSE